MRPNAENAWRTAARCATLAQEADEKEEREFYLKMRDAWIALGNRCQFLDVGGDEPATIGGPAGAVPSPRRRQRR
jgi:hypothetical protein